MIKKLKSNLAVKVFLITASLTAICCSITYFCISRYAPYIYTYKISDVENLPAELSLELAQSSYQYSADSFVNVIQVLYDNYNDEYLLHFFDSDGDEWVLPYMDKITEKHINDFDDADTTEHYTVYFADKEEPYTLFIAKNTEKESQIAIALRKAIPVLSIIIVLLSVSAALFYTWYIALPIKKVSKLSKQMADLDFSGICPVERTDEIGILSSSLNELSGSLSSALQKLQKANQKLQDDIDRERQIERQRLEFFSAASHELKTPVTIIKGQLQGMLCQVGRYKDRDAYLARSLEVTNKLEQMVQELLTVSRMETPGYTCTKINFDFSSLINERLNALEDFFLQKDLSLEKSILPQVQVCGDPQLLMKVVDNLLGNAVSYSPPGNQVFVTLHTETNKIVFSVENTGVRIPDQDIPKLFEAFYRVEQSRNRQTGGSGLGLYIVKTILDLHHATIEISNTSGGVIVTVKL